MQLMFQILVRTIVLGATAAALSGCGQQGPLYLPTQAAAPHRASLPESLLPSSGTATEPVKQPSPQ